MGNLIWFHGASVGEIQSIIPLIENYEKDKTINQILITSSTLSSSKILEKFKFKKTIHQFYPLDHIYITSKFLRYWKPNIAIFIESEIWPCMFKELEKRKIPIVLLNARITQKTFDKWMKLKNFTNEIFNKITIAYPQNLETKYFLKKLKTNKVKTIGNLKFIENNYEKFNTISNKLKSQFKTKKIWVASSTHSDEEIFCAKTHIQLKKKIKNLITIIIPRHIERTNEISQMLDKKKLKFIKHSESRKKFKNFDIYIVDSYGESKSFYKISNVVFLGGSLVSKGGQNPLEALRFGCNIIHGNYTYNFKDVYKMLEKEKLSLRVSGSKELERKVLTLFNKKNNSKKIKKLNKIGNLILEKNLSELKKIVL